jgi:hypothetical protein
MMYTFCRARGLAVLAGFLPLLLSPIGARASSLFYEFTNVFAGTAPQGSPSWINSQFSDTTPGMVQLKISANGLSGGEFLSALFFNLDPTLNPKTLSFTYVGSSGSFALPTIKTGADAFKADGQGKFDIDFTFSEKASKEFNGSDYVVYDVTSSAFALTSSDFDFVSTAAGGCSDLLAAAEISGIPIPGCTTTDTGWIAPGGVTPAPEPRGFALLALGGGLGAAASWRRRRVRSA